MISASDAFDPVRSALEQAGVRYAIGGSWASTAFGEPRFTNDVDILADFTPETLGSIPQRPAANGLCGSGGRPFGLAPGQTIE